MPHLTKEHEASIELFGQHCELLSPVLGAMGLEVPQNAVVRPASERFTEISPSELNADCCLLVESDGQVRMAVIYEVQRSQDPAKRFSWPRYVTGAWARFEIPVTLLVYCPDPATAKWASEPIVMGRDCVITPTILSPASLPVITNASSWRGGVELAVVSALIHAEEPEAPQIFRAISQLLSTIETSRAEQYAKTLLVTVPATVYPVLEAIMTAGTFAYQNAFDRIEESALRRGEAKGEARGEAKGIVKGEAKALMLVLSTRGIDVPDEASQTINACTSSEQFDIWLTRAVTAGNIDDVLG